MSGIFLKLFNMSVSAGWLILAIVLVRFVFRKAPKWFNCLLWALVAVRLICPFSIESRFSLLPNVKAVNTIENAGKPYISSGIAAVDNTVNKYLGEQYHEGAAVPVKDSANVKSAADLRHNLLHIIVIVWLIGAVSLFVYALVSYLHLQRRVSESVRLQKNIFLCDRIQTPFILGMIKPRIFLPVDMNELQMENVIAHEQAHIVRRDYLWKPLGYILLAVYWFNPLCLLAYILLCRDIEMACDEKVIRDMDVEAKKEYSMVLLSCSVSGKMLSACPLAFGEVGVKERVKGILNYKKPTFWVLAVSALVCVVAAVCFLTNPKNGTYKIKIRIPAHSEASVYYSDMEISPQKKTIFFEVEPEVGDTEIKLVPIEAAEENAYDEPAYVTSGMPAKMNVEKGAWFQVGIYAGNESDEEITLYVTVRNVEVRIASAAATGLMPETNQSEVNQGETNQLEANVPAAGFNAQEEQIEVKAPVIDLYAPTGADGSQLYYADKEKFIFGGYYGLFVYDMINREIIRSVDLAPIGCNMTQGDAACEVSVAEDGMTVFLHPMNQEQMYVYQVADNTMVKKPYNLEGVSLYHNQQYDYEEYGRYASYEKGGRLGFMALVHDTTIGELGYFPEVWMSKYYDTRTGEYRYAPDSWESTYYPIFRESSSDAYEVINRVIRETGLENAYEWNNTAEFKEDADILIRMAVDSTGEYEVYGISSAEYGNYGMILNNIIDGEDNWSYVYEPWIYTGAPDDTPTLEWTEDGELIFSYNCINRGGKRLWCHRPVDCGYETGHMELGQSTWD